MDADLGLSPSDGDPGTIDYAPTYRVVDLFCGAGGLSLGFSMTGRFAPVLGCDIMPEATSTFQANHAKYGNSPATILGDIREVTQEQLLNALGKHAAPESDLIDCLIGGPPCEGFSQNRSLNSGGQKKGVRASRIHRFIDDPRNYLFKWFLSIADLLKPRVILIENVPALLRHKDGKTLDEVFSTLSALGYTATARVLNAADFGVPQMRRRAFLLAQRTDDLKTYGTKLQFPEPTHRPYKLVHESLAERTDWLPSDSGYWPTVWEAIGDLPPPTKDDDYDHTETTYPPAPLSGLRAMLRNPDGTVPYNHIARPLGKSGLARVKSLLPGQTAKELPEKLKPRSFYHYSYCRLSWEEPARTITKFAYYVGSGMYAHPTEDRGITMREAARLQTYPDSYAFEAKNIRELSALIGNSVPPLLAKQIGRQIARYLDDLLHHKLSRSARPTFRLQKTDAVLKRMEADEWLSDGQSSHQMELNISSNE